MPRFPVLSAFPVLVPVGVISVSFRNDWGGACLNACIRTGEDAGKILNESISIEPAFGGNALEWVGPLVGEILDFS
ncbi:MAG: hypothetical protein ABF479_15095 [Gluconacetobacter sp.]|uniref:Uncharacterized protein n=1 Tax=Gluconacetobacter dulcium TaxID=2729096 RepID=A0A7W4JXR2_9PROT|nr:hypothetical protein [Gluconacetobacter dulcium]MBB2196648.1 hypothetical protein [Gluconacetobacter dulcium]